MFLLAVSVHAADSQAGTWILNLTKSQFAGAQAPKTQVTTIEAIEGGLKNVTDIIDAEGKSIHYEFTAVYGGKDYPVNGDPARDSVSIKKKDDLTLEGTNKKDGTVVGTVRAIYARHGRERTMSTTGVDAPGAQTT